MHKCTSQVRIKKFPKLKRLIIIELHSTEKKTEIMKACLTVEPNLHINESLTPKCR